MSRGTETLYIVDSLYMFSADPHELSRFLNLSYAIICSYNSEILSGRLTFETNECLFT